MNTGDIFMPLCFRKSTVSWLWCLDQRSDIIEIHIEFLWDDDYVELISERRES